MTTTLIMMTIDSPLGPLRLVADDGDADRRVPAGADRARGARGARRRCSRAPPRSSPSTSPASAATFDLPLAPRGTGFQQRVWRALAKIPFGETRSYGELARAIGRPSASRAVGAANGKNPISIIVPCHRVIAASGALTGYAGGLAAKRWLLEHEARAAAGAGVSRAAGARAAAR